ncbi:GDYXXLXY domain-containing protein [Wukongibacter sp. M2B1]
MDYTLDKYFVPKNTGKELEEKVRAGEALAKIKVYKGYPLLEEIVLR